MEVHVVGEPMRCTARTCLTPPSATSMPSRFATSQQHTASAPSHLHCISRHLASSPDEYCLLLLLEVCLLQLSLAVSITLLLLSLIQPPRRHHRRLITKPVLHIPSADVHQPQPVRRCRLCGGQLLCCALSVFFDELSSIFEFCSFAELLQLCVHLLHLVCTPRALHVGGSVGGEGAAVSGRVGW